jgi:hypothetical protein
MRTDYGALKCSILKNELKGMGKEATVIYSSYKASAKPMFHSYWPAL